MCRDRRQVAFNMLKLKSCCCQQLYVDQPQCQPGSGVLDNSQTQCRPSIIFDSDNIIYLNCFSITSYAYTLFCYHWPVPVALTLFCLKKIITKQGRQKVTAQNNAIDRGESFYRQYRDCLTCVFASIAVDQIISHSRHDSVAITTATTTTATTAGTATTTTTGTAYDV